PPVYVPAPVAPRGSAALRKGGDAENERKYFYRRDGVSSGPWSARELRELALTGRLFPTDEVRKDGRSSWKRAVDLKGLFAGLEVPLPSAVPVVPPSFGPVEIEEPASLPTQAAVSNP